ncbi:serine hydrolase FSH [Jackrogersella minutella]|nr:serine hydrolase FSH [Jackrogersella minutella]
MAFNAPDSTLHLPRLLCLHGGGTNARIFRAQLRVISRMLEPHLRLVFAEAPFESAAGPDVLSVYAEHGPFKRWLRWLPDHAETEDDSAIAEIDGALRDAMLADDRAGATGSWVGLLGFSQGAKLSASLLFRQQVRTAKLGRKHAGSDWKFAVIMAGRAPIVNLDPETFTSSMLSHPSQIGLTGGPDLMDMVKRGHILSLPTIHLHGLNDPGLNLHRELLKEYCEPASARVLEWDGAHRVPLKGTDVQPLIDQILEVARETGALKA